DNETMKEFFARIKKEKPDLLKSFMKKAKNEYLKEKKELKEKIKNNSEYPNDVKAVASHLYHNEVRKLFDKREFKLQNYRSFLIDVAKSGKLDFQVFINGDKQKTETKKANGDKQKKVESKKTNDKEKKKRK